MAKSPYNMKGFSGFGNESPLKQKKLFGIGDSTDASGKPVMAALVNKQQLTKEQRRAYSHVKAIKLKKDPLSSDKDYDVAGKTKIKVKKDRAEKSAVDAAKKLRKFGKGPKGY